MGGLFLAGNRSMESPPNEPNDGNLLLPLFTSAAAAEGNLTVPVLTGVSAGMKSGITPISLSPPNPPSPAKNEAEESLRLFISSIIALLLQLRSV